jgi:hypothetical protein
MSSVIVTLWEGSCGRARVVASRIMQSRNFRSSYKLSQVNKYVMRLQRVYIQCGRVLGTDAWGVRYKVGVTDLSRGRSLPGSTMSWLGTALHPTIWYEVKGNRSPLPQAIHSIRKGLHKCYIETYFLLGPQQCQYVGILLASLGWVLVTIKLC